MKTINIFLSLCIVLGFYFIKFVSKGILEKHQMELVIFRHDGRQEIVLENAMREYY